MKGLANHILEEMSANVSDLKEGLDPENIAWWYEKIVSEAKEMAPPWLVEKINIKQDAILHMKFNIDISKRAIRYMMMAIENHIDEMPYSTRLYFLKVQEIMSIEMDKSLV